MAQNWSAATSWGQVCARANGRRRYHSIRRLKARIRRVKVARRLNELRDEAWRKFGRGESKRPPRWVPHGAIARLAREFQVSYDTILADLKAIDAWPEPAPQGQPDPRFTWAWERAAMSKRITVRLPDEVFARLSEAVKGEGMDVSGVIRQALTAYLDEAPSREDPGTDRGAEISPHELEDCVRTLLAQCVPERAERLTAIAQQLRRPLSEVVGELVAQGLRMKWWWNLQAPGS